MRLIVKNGKKWSMISRIIGSRNENSVKNRFFALKRKFTKSYKQIPQSEKKMIIFIADKLLSKIKPGKKDPFAVENSQKSENLDEEDDDNMEFSFEKPSKKMKIKIERKKRELTVEIKKPGKNKPIVNNIHSFTSPLMNETEGNNSYIPSYNPSYNLASTEIIDSPFTNLLPENAVNQTPLTLSMFHPRNERKNNKNQENNTDNNEESMPQPRTGGHRRRSPLKAQTQIPVASPKEYIEINKEFDDMNLLYMPSNFSFAGEEFEDGQELQRNMCFYQIPNMYKAFQRDSPPVETKKPVKLYPNKEILDIMKLPFDIINEDQNDDDASRQLSQFLSSMSLSDQYIHESNKILSGINFNANNSLNSSSRILTESFQRSNSKHHTVTITHSSQRSSYLDSNISPFLNSMVTPRNYNINNNSAYGNSLRDTLNNCNNSNNFLMNGNMNNFNNFSNFQRITNKKITLVPSCESVVAIRKEKINEMDNFIENNNERNESELSLGHEYLAEYKKE